MGEISAALRVELLAIGVTPALLIAALAWWFRERLKQSLAKALNTHTEQVKLSAQRDIEAYKVSLIASIERQKAQSELKKAIAIKHATHEYEALVALHARLGEVPSSVISTAAIVSAAKLGEPERLEYYRRIDSQLNSFGDAIDLAHLFIAPEHVIALLDLRGDLIRIAHDYVLQEAAEVIPVEAQRRVTTVISPLRNQIRDRVAQLIRIADDSGLI